jgi:hypothetical protein
MQARIIRDDIEVSPSAVLSEDEQIQTVERTVWRNGANQTATFWELGAILERPDSYMLVRMGVAEPADEECRIAASMNAAQRAEAQHAARRLSAGIHPDDFRLFDAGIITGYNPDGTYKPGPNYGQLPQDTDDEDDE